MIKQVAVIGCGPAGLAAVHAAVGLGHDVELIAPIKKSELRGPLLLQRPIPGITLTHPDAYIKQYVIGGNILDYRYKLYGDVNININGDVLQSGYHAWRLDATYDAMWERYVKSAHRQVWVNDFKVSSTGIIGLADRFDQVINTAPANKFCRMPQVHIFESKLVAIRLETAIEQDENTICFNADKSEPWVRSSRIFGNVSTEWPIESAPEDHITIRKPIFTDCDCNPRVFRTGRYGAWKNETWVDSAYYQTREALMDL